MDQWISQNAALITFLFVVAALCTIAEFVWKPLRSIISFCRSRVNRRHTRRMPLAPADLRFVAVPFQCFFAVVHRDGEQPTADIRTHWNVTNASASGMPAKLLTARLAKPRLRDQLGNAPIGVTSAVVVSVNGELIPPGATREVAIHFLVVLPYGRLNKPIKLEIVVVDQLENEHKLRPITLKPIMIEPAGK